jgi:hypothetical protein
MTSYSCLHDTLYHYGSIDVGTSKVPFYNCIQCRATLLPVNYNGTIQTKDYQSTSQQVSALVLERIKGGLEKQLELFE